MAYELSELQEKWLQALESGEYGQCEAVLHDGAGYCVLGVACEVVGLKKRKRGRQYYYSNRTASAPNSVVSKLRLWGSSGECVDAFYAGFPHIELSSANDAGMPFPEIAAAIRANPENFFK